LKCLLAKDIDLDTDVIKVSLHTSAYSPSQNSDEFRSSTTASEVAATGGYTTGGIALTSPVQLVGTNFIWAYDAADTVWPASTITARFAVVYDSTPATDATRRLILWQDFGVDVSSTGGNFTITWATAGLFQATFS
jgi:hypothetical protein